MASPWVAISGVAPRAYVMSYRVFYNSANGNAQPLHSRNALAALEDIVWTARMW